MKDGKRVKMEWDERYAEISQIEKEIKKLEARNMNITVDNNTEKEEKVTTKAEGEAELGRVREETAIKQKKPPNVWILYRTKRYQEIKAEYPTETKERITEKISIECKKLTDTEKHRLKDDYEEKKSKAEKEKEQRVKEDSKDVQITEKSQPQTTYLLPAFSL